MTIGVYSSMIKVMVYNAGGRPIAAPLIATSRRDAVSANIEREE